MLAAAACCCLLLPASACLLWPLPCLHVAVARHCSCTAKERKGCRGSLRRGAQDRSGEGLRIHRAARRREVRFFPLCYGGAFTGRRGVRSREFFPLRQSYVYQRCACTTCSSMCTVHVNRCKQYGNVRLHGATYADSSRPCLCVVRCMNLPR